MVKMEGRLLNTGKLDKCGRIFSKDCKITIPSKIPITINFNNDQNKVVGYGQVIKDDKGLKVFAELTHDESVVFNDPEYNVGGFYTNIKSHYDLGTTIIDECKLVRMALVLDPIDDDLVIRRID